MNQTFKPFRQAGFSLLETLVAFSILALSLGLLLKIFGGASLSSQALVERAHAVVLAESLLSSILAETPLPLTDQSGEIEGIYRWYFRISPYLPLFETLPEPLLLKPYWVEMRLEWGSDSHQLSLATLRLVPVNR